MQISRFLTSVLVTTTISFCALQASTADNWKTDYTHALQAHRQPDCVRDENLAAFIKAFATTTTMPASTSALIEDLIAKGRSVYQSALDTHTRKAFLTINLTLPAAETAVVPLCAILEASFLHKPAVLQDLVHTVFIQKERPCGQSPLNLLMWTVYQSLSRPEQQWLTENIQQTIAVTEGRAHQRKQPKNKDARIKKGKKRNLS